MKLLMITRKVDEKDSSPAGFTYNWVKKIGQKLEKLYVITWQKSARGDLPENIEIISLPNNKLLKIFVLPFKLFRVLPKVNGVFCHQNPEYTILAAPWAKLFGKKLVTWYAHGYVGWKLHLVNWLADKILTSSDKGCRLKYRKKIEVIGQGIDVDYFNKQLRVSNERSYFKILSIGRISPAKDYQTLIQAVGILVKNGIRDLRVQIVGGPALKRDREYFNDLKDMAEDRGLKNYVGFLGPIAHHKILSYYQDCDLFINSSHTGSMDKAVLESMACERLVLTCNEAFIDLLDDQRFIFQKKNPQDLAQKIINLMNLPLEKKQAIVQQLRDKVVKNHDLDNLVNRIISQYEKN